MIFLIPDEDKFLFIRIRFNCGHMLKKQVCRVSFAAHNEFFDHFVEQWLENEEIPVVLWTCYHRRHRTNNAVEGWNNKVNSGSERPHLNIKKYSAAYKQK
jgi:hypothetical protein